MKKQYVLMVVSFIASVWSPEIDGQQVYARIHRGVNTDYAAMVFIKETVANAVQLSINHQKKDPVACGNCLIQLFNNFSNLVMAIREDERIEDAIAAKNHHAQHRADYRSENLSFALQDVQEAFSSYVHSPEGLAELDSILNQVL